MFRLHFNCENQGDGSVSVNFFNTDAEAEDAELLQSEGWGESSVDHLDLFIDNGKIYRSYLQWDGAKFIKVVEPLEQV